MRLYRVNVALRGAGFWLLRTWLIVARSEGEARRLVPVGRQSVVAILDIDDVGAARDPRRLGVIGWTSNGRSDRSDDAVIPL